MTRECSGCGDKWCDGRCYLECEADYEPYVEAPELDRLTVCQGDPLRGRAGALRAEPLRVSGKAAHPYREEKDAA